MKIKGFLKKNIQNQWKKIGHIPRSESNKLWKQFRSACNHFFDRYHEQKNAGTPEQIETLAQKEQLLEALKSFKIGADKAANLDSVKGYSKQWSELGEVPKNKRQIDRVFFKAVRTLLIEIGVSEEEVKALNYSNKLQELTNCTNKYLIDYARDGEVLNPSWKSGAIDND